MYISYLKINCRLSSQIRYCTDRRPSCSPVFILSLINPRVDLQTIDETRTNIGPPRQQSSSSWPSRIITRKESNGSLLSGVLLPSRRDQRGDDIRGRRCCFRPVRRRVTVLTGKRVRNRFAVRRKRRSRTNLRETTLRVSVWYHGPRIKVVARECTSPPWRRSARRANSRGGAGEEEDEETKNRRKSEGERKEERTRKVKRERGRNQEVKADRYSWTIQVAQQPAGSGTLSLLGPGSLEPVRLVSVFASIGSILRNSSVVHPSSTLFLFAFSLPFFLPACPFDRVNASLSPFQCVFRRLLSSYFVPAASFILRYVSRYSRSLQSSVALSVVAIISG